MKVNIYLETDKQCQACIQRKYGCVLGSYSTEEKALHVLSAIQVAANHSEKIRVFRMPTDTEVKA